MSKHTWTKEEDKITFFAYKFKNKQEQREIANRLNKENGISKDSFIMRMCNFMYLATDGKKGLKNCAQQSKDIYIQYKDRDIDEFGLKF